jgi:SAM-dependent methyltransferase
MKNDHFQTKYGDRIDFIDGYFELFPDLLAQYQDTIEIYDNFEEHLKKKGQDQTAVTPPVWGAGYLARHARTAKMIEMLEKYGARRKYKSVLDIGTGYGVMPRLMKAFGLADKAYGLDLTDRTYFVSSQQILDYESDLARSKTMDAIKVQVNLRPTDWAFKGTQPEFGFSMNNHSFFPKVETSNIDMDGLIIDDVYKQQQKHDLITSFASLCCFDSDKIMEKVSNLLEDGGVFFVYVNLWWFPINSTILIGHFPFAHARLDRDDWTRYAQENHPDHFAKMNRLYDVLDPKHPTVSTYIETAAKNDLTLLGYERCIQTQAHDPRSRFSPNYMEKFFENSYLTEVLKNIRRFRSDVSIEDLHTSHVHMAFQKRGKPSKLNIDQSFKQKSRESLDEYGSHTTMKPNDIAEISVSGDRLIVVMEDGSGPFALPITRCSATMPENLAGSGVRLMCESVDEDLMLNVWDGDTFIGTIVVGAGPVTDFAPDMEADATLNHVNSVKPGKVSSIVGSAWSARNELKHRAIAVAAKQLPPSVKAAIKKYIWKP